MCGGSDGTVRVWNVAGGSVVLRGHTDQVVSAAFDATGSRVLSVSQDGSARIWDLPIQAGDRSSSMRSAALNPDAARLVVNDRDKIQVWDAHTGGKLVDSRPPGLTGEGVSACDATPMARVEGAPPPTATLSPTGAVVLTTDSPRARVWEAATGRVLSTCNPGADVN